MSQYWSSCTLRSYNWVVLSIVSCYIWSRFCSYNFQPRLGPVLNWNLMKDHFVLFGYFYCCVVATHELRKPVFLKRDDLMWCKSGFRTQPSFGRLFWVGFVEKREKNCKNLGLIEELQSGVCPHVGVRAVNTLQCCNYMTITREQLKHERRK